MDGGGWYVTKGDTGQRGGPVTDAAFRKALLDGQIGADDLVWCDGMGEWERAEPFIWFAGKAAPQTDAQPEKQHEPQPQFESDGAADAVLRPAPDTAGIGRLERPETGVIGKVLGREISISEPDLADFIGTNAEPYLKFRQKLIDKGGRVWFSWCWPGFFVPMAWLAYRRQYGFLFAASIGFTAFIMAVMALALLYPPLMLLSLVVVAYPFIFALVGKRWVLLQADKAARLADELGLAPAKRPHLLAAEGGVSRLGGWAGAVVYIFSLAYGVFVAVAKLGTGIPKVWQI